MGDVHGEDGEAERDAEGRAEGQERGGEALDAGAVAVLPGGEGEHGGDDDAAVDEVDDRVGGGCGLVSEVAHELGGGRAAVDEQERDGDREQRDGEHGDADDGTDAGDGDADDGKTPSDDDADAGGEGSEDDEQAKQTPSDQDAITPQAKPLFDAELPADLEAKRVEIDGKEDSLVEQFDNGDITFAEYNKQLRDLSRERRELDRIEFKAELSREAQQNQVEQGWQVAQATFFASHPEIDQGNQAQMAALDYLVRTETQAVLEKGGAIGVPELERAYAKFKQSFSITDTAKQETKEQSQPKPKKQVVVPPNLGKVPASAATDTDDGKFAHLDRLAESDPMAFEEALGKMTDAQRDEYMRAG